MKQRNGGLLFGIGVGLVFAFMSYQWITNPAPREERQLEEAVVLDARNYLREVSGYYRRDDSDRWHAFLMSLDDARNITHLKVQDSELAERASEDPKLEVST